MDKFVEKCNLPTLNEEAANLNRLITAGKIKAVTKKKSWHTKAGDHRVSQENFTKHFKKS